MQGEDAQPRPSTAQGATASRLSVSLTEGAAAEWNNAMQGEEAQPGPSTAQGATGRRLSVSVMQGASNTGEDLSAIFKIRLASASKQSGQDSRPTAGSTDVSGVSSVESTPVPTPTGNSVVSWSTDTETDVEPPLLGSPEYATRALAASPAFGPPLLQPAVVRAASMPSMASNCKPVPPPRQRRHMLRSRSSSFTRRSSDSPQRSSSRSRFITNPNGSGGATRAREPASEVATGLGLLCQAAEAAEAMAAGATSSEQGAGLVEPGTGQANAGVEAVAQQGNRAMMPDARETPARRSPSPTTRSGGETASSAPSTPLKLCRTSTVTPAGEYCWSIISPQKDRGQASWYVTHMPSYECSIIHILELKS